MSDRRDADRLACAFRVLGCAMHYRPLAPSDTIVSGAAVTLIDMASTGTADDRARAILDGLAPRRLPVERVLRGVPALHGGPPSPAPSRAATVAVASNPSPVSAA